MQWISFLLGYAALGVAILLAILFPEPSRFQVAVFALCCGVACGGIANGLAGTIGLKLGWLTASGAIAIAVVTAYVVIRIALPELSLVPAPTRP